MKKNCVTPVENGSANNTGRSLSKILFIFLKIGFFTFGGGYAILPMIQLEIVDRQGWVDSETFLDILVISQSLPGPLALSSSFLVGRRLRGTAGGLISALGIVLPSFATILLLAAFLLPVIWDNVFVRAIFYGLRPAVVALVTAAAWELGKKSIKDRPSLLIFTLLLAISLIFRLHPVLVLALGAALGLIFFGKPKLQAKEPKP